MSDTHGFNLINKLEEALKVLSKENIDKYYKSKEIADKIVELYPRDCENKI